MILEIVIFFLNLIIKFWDDVKEGYKRRILNVIFDKYVIYFFIYLKFKICNFFFFIRWVEFFNIDYYKKYCFFYFLFKVFIRIF